MFILFAFFPWVISDRVDVLQHFMVKLVYFILKEFTDLSTGQINLVLMLQLSVLQLIQKLDEVVYRIVQDCHEVLLMI